MNSNRHRSDGGVAMTRGTRQTLEVLAIIVVLGIVSASSLIAEVSSVDTPLVTTTDDVKDGIRFTMSLQKTTFTLGEPVNITFTVTNISNQNKTFRPQVWDFDFLVYDQSNHCIFDRLLFLSFYISFLNMTLSPLSNFTRFLVWRQTYKQTGENPNGVQAPQGRYFIVGYYDNEFFNSSLNLLKTNPLEVQVVLPMPVAVAIAMIAVALVVAVTATGFILTRKR
jgi:hypothetical protein